MISVIATVLLGPLLLVQLYYLAPRFLFISVLLGWMAYVIASVGVALKTKYAYYAVTILALLVLILSLPQPEHYTFFNSGNLLAGFTFVFGDLLQVFVILFVVLSLRAWQGEK
jgi:lysylphosphatidylglycerol synthetase-like protein (DUF2156 family)